MTFAEKGAVSDIEPALFVGYLHRLKATGTLKFEDGAIQRAMYLRDGRVLFSSSNAPEDQLGAILVAGGKISQEQFDAIVAGLEPKQSIAAALAQGGHVSQRDIGDAARRKVEQIVASCCAQTTGQYEFEDGVLPKGALDLKLTTERVLAAAFDVLEPSGFLNRILKSPVAVLAPTEIEPADADLAKVRAALDGVSTISDIAGIVGLPPGATAARAAVLVVIGAASVLTSQIEEMSLPDTGEDSSGVPDFQVTNDTVGLEAETLAFAPPAPTIDTNADSTLIMPTDSGLGGSLGSSEATVMIDSGLGFGPPPKTSDSGIIRMSGGAKREPKATTQDLDAVKELISSPAPPRPGSASIPNQTWEPKLSSESRTGRESGLAAAFSNPTVKRVAGIIGIALVAGLAWVGYTLMQPPPAEPVAPPAPTPVATVAAAVPVASASPAVAGFASPSPAVSASRPTAAATPAPAASAPVSTPALRATPVPTPVRTAAATPAPTAQAAAATTPAPAPRATTPPPAAGGGDAYVAMKAGRLAEAATAFANQARARSAEFSVQLVVACVPQTIEKAIQNDPSPELFVLPASIGGKACHRLMRGYYKTAADATQAMGSLPGYYAAENAKPRAVPVKSVLP